ncbi:DCC1-like thiol-disulfide oxidoreductase family protein [Spirosoma horti]
MKTIIVFDDVCGFCNSFVQFVIQRDAKAYFSFASSHLK